MSSQSDTLLKRSRPSISGAAYMHPQFWWIKERGAALMPDMQQRWQQRGQQMRDKSEQRATAAAAADADADAADDAADAEPAADDSSRPPQYNVADVNGDAEGIADTQFMMTMYAVCTASFGVTDEALLCGIARAMEGRACVACGRMPMPGQWGCWRCIKAEPPIVKVGTEEAFEEGLALFFVQGCRQLL